MKSLIPILFYSLTTSVVLAQDCSDFFALAAEISGGESNLINTLILRHLYILTSDAIKRLN